MIIRAFLFGRRVSPRQCEYVDSVDHTYLLSAADRIFESTHELVCIISSTHKAAVKAEVGKTHTPFPSKPSEHRSIVDDNHANQKQRYIHSGATNTPPGGASSVRMQKK